MLASVAGMSKHKHAINIITLLNWFLVPLEGESDKNNAKLRHPDKQEQHLLLKKYTK